MWCADAGLLLRTRYGFSFAQGRVVSKRGARAARSIEVDRRACLMRWATMRAIMRTRRIARLGGLILTAAAAETPQASVGGEMGGWATQRGLLFTPGDEDVNDEVECSGREGRSASQESRESRVGRGSGGLSTKARTRR